MPFTGDFSPASGGLYRKLVLLMAVRLAVGTALLVATAWLTVGQGSFPRGTEAWLFAIIGGIYLVSLVGTFVLRTGHYLTIVAHAQIVADVITATGLVYLTGGAESIFTILYPLAIVSGAIGLGRRGAGVGAAASCVGFCLLAWGVDSGLVEPIGMYLDRAPLPPGRLAVIMAANLSAFLLVGGLAAYLAEQLQGARSKLAESETQLSTLQAIYSAVVRSIASGILTLDEGGRVTYLNPAAEELTGLTDEAARGQLLSALFPELAVGVGSRPDRGRAEVRLSVRGQERILGYAVARLSQAPGKVILFQDLTELRQMEEAMRRSDRMAVVGGLAAGLAHEIRNPLASMCGSIEILGGSPHLDGGERRLMHVVLDEAQRLESLVRDFLSFARPASPMLERLDGAEAVAETVELFRPQAAERGIDVAASTEGVFLRADARQFRQVLWNLLGNAADATARGGSVQVSLARRDGHALLEVSDSGEGIAQNDLQRIFEPFFTTKQRGTGLGLAIVHRIVEAHGGELSVRSEPGRGSTFRVVLPLAPDPAALRPAAAV